MAKESTILTRIHTIDELIPFLRDELDWPIENYEKEDLSFEYSADELGLKEDEAAKIKSIFQLRPLAYEQPWGIFFIEFEKKKLPIVVMRRILSALVQKRRQIKTKQHTWHMHDLLFINRYGEDDDPHITFAHFQGDENSADLPKLKVLGWDGDDTVLALDYVMKELKTKMHWPDDTNDLLKWREMWASAFTIRHNEVIHTSQELALHLAELARGIRNRAIRVLSMETKKGKLRGLMKEFKEALIHDLTENTFADMYAQTISYGLLAARVSRPAGIIADNVKDMVPMTNPFLREMLSIFLIAGGRDRKNGFDFDELGVQDVVELLNHCNMEAVLRDFGNRTRQEDPVIHFYELFLKAYDAEMKIKRGVFYTPQPVVSFIVRSVHELLQTEFGLQDGLASTVTWEEMSKKHPDLKIPEGTSPKSPFVVILDPATGTGTFLVEVIDVIHRTVIDKWKKAGFKETQIKDAWNKYVPTNLLPRLFGYELMMAPYAIAHMKIGLKLHETGYTFSDEQQALANIYLTNALEPASDIQLGLELFATPLAKEATTVNEVKREQTFTVIVGNPPYAVEGVNKNNWIEQLMGEYRNEVKSERNIQLLSDDYAKFLRLADWIVGLSQYGIVAMITKNTYLNTTAFRGMRKRFLSHFNQVNVLDLHGKLYGKTPKGDPDINIFEIRVGVAILFARKTSDDFTSNCFGYKELWGAGDCKLETLSTLVFKNAEWEKVLIDKNQWGLEPATRGDADQTSLNEYKNFTPLLSLVIDEDAISATQGYRWGSGVKTNRDYLLVAFEQNELNARLQLLASPVISTEKVKKDLGLDDGRYWNTERERRKLFLIKWENRIFPYLFGPFDERFIAHIPSLIEIGRGGASKRLMHHFQSTQNIGLILKRRNLDKNYHHVFITRLTSDINCLGGQTYTIPLIINGDSAGSFDSTIKNNSLTSNFLQGVKLINRVLPNIELSAFDVFSYTYCVLHSPTYRSRYGRELRKEFPQIPLPKTVELMASLSRLGSSLIEFHLMESLKIDKHISSFTGKGDNSIPKKPTYKDGAVWINSTQKFEDVPEDVWNFHIGGYQVCEKWLKDRKGLILSTEDIEHYNKIIVALNETIRIMKEIDEVIEKHGGWPGAFVTKS